MTCENILRAYWQVPEKVQTLITQFDSCFPDVDSLEVETGKHFGFNVATHVGDEPEKVLARRRALQKKTGALYEIDWLSQVHGNACINLDEKRVGQDVLEYDASYSFEAGRVCVVSTADCLPILLTDKQGNFVCAIHAGWQGLYKDIIGRTLDSIRETAARRKIELAVICAYIAPAISQKNYQVDETFRQRFVDKNSGYQSCFIEDGSGKYLADLKAIATMQLKQAEVSDISDSGICTYEHTSFYSHRRASQQGQAPCGRFASMIWLAE